ncbi:hypothetical protein HAX54_004743, partial [Datura stramonium]|nr:hypothetical protein [Datura stramonium]
DKKVEDVALELEHTVRDYVEQEIPAKSRKPVNDEDILVDAEKSTNMENKEKGKDI